MGISNKDEALVAAVGAMLGQLDNDKIRERLERALKGEAEPRRDELRQEVVTGSEAARVLNCSVRHVQHLAARGAIKRVVEPGSSRGRGYVRRSVEALAQGGAA